MPLSFVIKLFAYWFLTMAAVGVLFWYTVTLPALKQKTHKNKIDKM